MSIKLARHQFLSSQQHDGGIYVLLLPAAAPKIRRPELPEDFNLGNDAISLIPALHTLVHTLLLLITVSGPKRDCRVKLNMALFRVAILLHRCANVAQSSLLALLSHSSSWGMWKLMLWRQVLSGVKLF